MRDNTTHFGFEKVEFSEKAEKVAGVFHSVANKYDIMNDLMSCGVHRFWKQIAIGKCRVKAGDYVLDLAGGTGDLSLKFAKLVGDNGLVTLSDINSSMLNYGRDKLVNNGILKPVNYLLADAQNIPVADNSYNIVSIAFGLRNVTDKDKALHEMYRALKPGGRAMILEFSHPENQSFSKLYDLYSFNILPKLGKIVANDESSYKYLVESIRMHPNQETLKSMMQTAGFEDVSYDNLFGGICAIHMGYKF